MTNSNIGWTAQSPQGWVHDEGIPGQTFTEDQLPHPEVQRASGINPEQYRRQHGLWVEPSEVERPAFVGTETGRSPEDVFQENGTMESFRSEPGEYPDSFYVSQYHGASDKGLEYPRSATGHILDSLHNAAPHAWVANTEVTEDSE